MKTIFDNDQKDHIETLPTLSVRHKLIQDFMPSPLSNTGLKSEKAQQFLTSLGFVQGKMWEDYYSEYPIPHTEIVSTDDGAKPVMVKRPRKNEICHVDSVSFTIGKETFDNLRTEGLSPEEREEECIRQLDTELQRITGFGIAEEMTGGKNYYQRSFKMENDTGLVSIGGQKDTILVQLNGTCALHARQGYELDLCVFLELEASRAKITRLDLAYDDFEGTYNVDWFDEQETNGGFNNGGKNPSVEYRGNWKRPNGKGRTLYIGSRNSSKYTRIYEKGKEQGDKHSPWVRVEVEYKAKHLYIPTEALVKPTEYFLGTYPVFHAIEFDLEDVQTKDFERKQQTASIIFSKAVDITRHQFGRYLYAFRHFYDDSQVLDMLMPRKNKEFPDRLDIMSVITHKSKTSEKDAVMLLHAINSAYQNSQGELHATV